jgi:ATP-dependent DNA helicase PIF1
MSPEQSLAFRKVIEKRESLFITGSAGTGKTFWIQQIYQECKKRKIEISVTALTGTAAMILSDLHLEASTFHSWCSIGIDDTESPEERLHYLRSRLKRSHHLAERNTIQTIIRRILSTEILIIDEVSMMSPKLLEKFNTMMKLIRTDYRHLPFGGLQIIFVGDFYQLPPVDSRAESGSDPQFIFQSSAWHQIIRRKNQCIVFHTNYRQSGDTLFTWILQQIRCGILNNEARDILLDKRKSAEEDFQKIFRETRIVPTKLYPRYKEVNEINYQELMKLDVSTHRSYYSSRVLNFHSEKDAEEFHSVWSPEMIATFIEMKDTTGKYLDNLQLRIGCQVMCTHNLDIGAGIMNGTRGIVIGLGDEAIRVRFVSGREHLFLRHLFPIIEWSSSSSEEKEKEIETEPFHLQTGQGLWISQFPLIHAWAMTIHKSQGQSIDFAEVDIGRRIFQPGQAYVALSRIRSLDGLILRGFSESSIRVNPDVMDFADAIGDNIVQKYYQHKKKLLYWSL